MYKTFVLHHYEKTSNHTDNSKFGISVNIKVITKSNVGSLGQAQLLSVVE